MDTNKHSGVDPSPGPNNKDTPLYTDTRRQASHTNGTVPDGPLTEMCATALNAIKADEHYEEGLKMTVLITKMTEDGERSENGVGFFGYDSPMELVELCIHQIQAVAERYGVTVGVMEMSEMPPEERLPNALGMMVDLLLKAEDEQRERDES